MLARRKETERKRIEECLADKGNHKIIVDRHRLEFNGDSRYATITRASENASKPMWSEALMCLWDYYPKIFFRSSSGVLIGAML